MNPAFDSHADKGTGIHACILHGSSGNIYDSRFAIYGHDALKPGETSWGQTWPEGGGGSVIEVGNDVGTALGVGNYSNCTFYALGENNLMIPNGTNPGSTEMQTGGNVFNWWGDIPLNGNVVGWAEGNNISGAVSHCAGGAYGPSANPPITFQHGRGSNTNQFVGSGGNTSQRYETGHGVVYNDCL
jgi:hypothetical protein